MGKNTKAKTKELKSKKTSPIFYGRNVERSYYNI